MIKYLLQMFTKITGIVIIITANVFAQTGLFGNAELVSNGYKFTEGPVWKNGYLLFSDIDGNKIYKWSPDSGDSIFISPSGGANGLAYDKDGKLIIAGHQSRNITRREDDRTLTVLADNYKGKKLNSPNDLTIKSNGAIFFTDPPWGIQTFQKELNFDGIFCLAPSGNLILLDSTVAYPNGIAFSPDESLLYVNESNTRKIYVWDVVNDSAISNKRLFASVNKFYGCFDGMKVDSQGRLFNSGPDGVTIFTPEGTPIDTIKVPETVTNCNFGEDETILFITAGKSVYRADLLVTGIDESNNREINEKSFGLVKLYPNPFNPETNISFFNNAYRKIKISVYDVLGKEISVIADKEFPAGKYMLKWNPEGVASGIYYVSMSSSGKNEIKKAVFVK